MNNKRDENSKVGKKIWSILCKSLIVVSFIYIFKKLSSINTDFIVLIKTEYLTRFGAITLLFTGIMLFQFVPWKIILESITNTKIPYSTISVRPAY